MFCTYVTAQFISVPPGLAPYSAATFAQNVGVWMPDFGKVMELQYFCEMNQCSVDRENRGPCDVCPQVCDRMVKLNEEMHERAEIMDQHTQTSRSGWPLPRRLLHADC